MVGYTFLDFQISLFLFIKISKGNQENLKLRIVKRSSPKFFIALIQNLYQLPKQKFCHELQNKKFINKKKEKKRLAQAGPNHNASIADIDIFTRINASF